MDLKVERGDLIDTADLNKKGAPILQYPLSSAFHNHTEGIYFFLPAMASAVGTHHNFFPNALQCSYYR